MTSPVTCRRAIVDPSDPNIVYPLQWSSGVPLTGENLWIDPAWVTTASGTPTDLGTICLQPCNRPEPPTTTEAPTTVAPAPPTTSPVPRPPIVGNGEGTFVQPDLPPVVMPPAQSTARPSTTQQALRSIPPPPAPVDKVAHPGRRQRLDRDADTDRGTGDLHPEVERTDCAREHQ